MEPDSRNLYRNHERACPRRTAGRDHKRCRCPIWVDFSSAGRRTCKSLRTRNWQRAEDLLRTMGALDRYDIKATDSVQMASQVGKPQAEKRTVEGACTAFIADAKARGLREPTLYKYHLLFQRLQAFAKERNLSFVAEFSVEELRNFRGTWRHRNTSARKRLEELRSFFRFCHDSGWIQENYAKRLRPSKETSSPTEPFTDEEMDRIRSACSAYPGGKGRAHSVHTQRIRAFVEVMVHSGLRIGDAIKLRWDSITEGKLRIRTEKTGTVVCCPLPQWVIEELNLVQGSSSEYFFWTGTSKLKSAIGNWQRTLKKLFLLAGVQGGHAHRFRHTFAKTLLMAGVPVENVSVLMGHRSPAITLKHYSAWVKERQEQLEAHVKRVWKG